VYDHRYMLCDTDRLPLDVAPCFGPPRAAAMTGGGGPIERAGVDPDLFLSSCLKCCCSYAPTAFSFAVECLSTDGDALIFLDGVEGRDLRGVMWLAMAPDELLPSNARGDLSVNGGLGILDGVCPGVLAADLEYVFLGVWNSLTPILGRL
jgi:hypothetical protein